MTEQRAISRRRVLKAGTIDFGNGSFDCVVRNLSDKGALLELAASIVVPQKFELAVRTEGLRKHCIVVWRGGWRVGVVFD